MFTPCKKSSNPQDAWTQQTTGNTRFCLTTAFSPMLVNCTRTTGGPLDVNIRRTNTASLFVGPLVAARSGPRMCIHWPTRGAERLCRVTGFQWRHQGGHGGISPPPSQRLCPPTCPPPSQKKKIAKISHFRQIFGFLPPQNYILPPRCPPTKKFWCRHCRFSHPGASGERKIEKI